MASPFPGMDPYIEQPQLWSDFHGDLAAEIRARLNRVIRPRYVALIDSYVTYEVIEIEETRSVRPDVVVRQTAPSGSEPRGPVATVTPAPARSTVPLELPLRHRRVRIRALDSDQIVTVIEILSPANKRPRQQAFKDYLEKRRDLLRTSVHLMEIDLLRGGTRPPLEEPVPEAPYYVNLSRGRSRPKVDVWPIALQDSLPILPVPLREPDPDVALDLGAIVIDVYERGGYEDLIDYRRPPPPPALSQQDATWVEGLLNDRRGSAEV